MGELFGMAGQIAAASMSADAAKYAADKQIEALEKQRDFVFKNLEPGTIGAEARAADIDRAKSRLALQGAMDPALLKTRYVAQEKMLQDLEGIGRGPSEAVAQQAAVEALSGGDVASQIKQRLIDSALDELNAGATLPSDVQAELVRAGLERSGAVSGAATSRGLGGNISREMVGERALALKSERQGKAIALSQAADALEQNRSALLTSLFPALKANQLANLSAEQSALQTSANELPQSALSGESVANIWLARVGATNQLSQAAADAAARGSMGQAQAWNNAIGGISGMFAGGTQRGTFPSTSQVWNSLFQKAPAPAPAATPASGGGGLDEFSVMAGYFK
jgi:hypothetical protein